MDLNEYQKRAIVTDSFDTSKEIKITDIAFMAKILGLVGESGEFAEKIKKIYRNNNGLMSEDEKAELIKELGDVLWYIAVLAKYFDTDLEKVAKINLDKLSSRKDRDVIKSKGDNR